MIQAQPQLIEAARRGEAQALAQLLAVCQPDLRRFARRTCSTTEDAEDAVQVALWQVYRKLGALRSVATFASWMFRIVERECFRLFHGRGRHLSLENLAEHETPAASAPAPGLRQDLVRAIADLAAPQREVLLMRDVEEWSAPEVAAQLGLSLEAVKSRLHRARAQVRQALLNNGYRLQQGMPRD